MRFGPFDRQEHVYRNDALVELVKDAVRFFNGTPVHPLPPPQRFLGTGIYALYYVGQHEYYKPYSELNRLAYAHPIYVGKAVPKGWRQSRLSDTAMKRSSELYSRLGQHSTNILKAPDFSLNDFSCRFVIFEDEGSDMIGTIEASLIKIHKPLWNSTVDGFGNHDPGKGRYQGAMPDWDVIHPGRPWAPKCLGRAKTREAILKNIDTHFKGLKGES